MRKEIALFAPVIFIFKCTACYFKSYLDYTITSNIFICISSSSFFFLERGGCCVLTKKERKFSLLSSPQKWHWNHQIQNVCIVSLCTFYAILCCRPRLHWISLNKDDQKHLNEWKGTLLSVWVTLAVPWICETFKQATAGQGYLR